MTARVLDVGSRSVAGPERSQRCQSRKSTEWLPRGLIVMEARKRVAVSVAGKSGYVAALPAPGAGA
jgi:hypothetical protein